MNYEDKRKYDYVMKHEMYISAYRMLIEEIEKESINENIIQLSKVLSNEVRHKAHSFASRKLEQESLEMDSLLKLIIKINGEGIYR